MNTRATSKELPISDRNYRITKMDPRLACYMFSTLASRADDGQLLSALGKLTRSEFDEVQNHSLRHVFRLDVKDDSVFPIPVIAPNGLFADKILEQNPAEVFKLTTESILFNIEPFLEGSKSTDQP